MEQMQSMVALLRAVNVGGTGRLAMADLAALCEEAGFQAVRTYIASGNVVFETSLSVKKAKNALEVRLQSYTGRPVGVVMRTAAEMAEVLVRNPFQNAPSSRVVAIFLDHATSPSTLDGVTGQGADETLRLGPREIYVCYGANMGRSRLRIPAADIGTARNMNTVAKLASMTAA